MQRHPGWGSELHGVGSGARKRLRHPRKTIFSNRWRKGGGHTDGRHAVSLSSTSRSTFCIQLAIPSKTDASEGQIDGVKIPNDGMLAQQLDQALPCNATLGETSSPKMQDVSPAARISSPRDSLSLTGGTRDSLSVYRARRRYRSVPASPREGRGWLTKHKENQ